MTWRGSKIEDESHLRYVELNPPIGVTFLNMRQQSFMISTAMRFSLGPDGPHKDHESTIYWYELACKNGALFC